MKLPKEVLDSIDIKDLNPPQKEAIKLGLFEKKNLVVASPTASGKTLIAEMAFLQNFLNCGKTVYIVPLRALASEKYFDFKEKYSKLGIRIAISVGDMDSSDEWLGNYDVIIVSNEKMDSLLRHGATWVRDVSLIIADEIHLLNDVSRGPTLEVVLTRLREMTNSQIIALSATIKNAEEIAEWLKAKLVKSNYRPIKLDRGVFYPYTLEIEDREQEITGNEDSEIILSRNTIEKKKQALIFVASRRSAEATSEKISNKISKMISDDEKKELNKLSSDILSVLNSPTKQCKRLAGIVSRGCAFHHAGLVSKQRRIIEDGFRSGLIKILVSTPTLAFGINLPAWRVLIRDAKRYSSFGYYGSQYIPVLEIQQMFGRAGRPKYDKTGEAILLAKTQDDAEDLKERYILGEPEPIYSKLSIESMLRMHILGLIAMGVTKSRGELESFLSKTFFAYQYGDINEIMEKTERILRQLESYKFITIGNKPFISSEFVPAFDIDRDVELQPTKIGKRVAQLYIDPVSANFIIQGLVQKDDIEYLMLISQCVEMEPLLRIKKNDYEDIEDELARSSIQAPDVWDVDYDSFLMAFKTSLMFNDWMDESSEDAILDKYGIAPGELYSKKLNAEWMLYAATELAVLLEKRDVANSLNKVKLRVKHGVRKDLLKLVKLKGIGRVRARLLRNNGVKIPSDLKRVDLKKILGPKIAAQILKNI